MEGADCLVVGSGPGGATTAAALAEAGRKVLLLEEGPDLPLTSAKAYTLAEMNQKYRNSGLTPSFGRTRVTYLEGRCLGGASEINAGLYHRPVAETLDSWAEKYGIENFGSRAMEPWIEGVERDFSVSYRPDSAGVASLKLQEGAAKQGWKCSEIARFWKYQKKEDGSWTGARQSMTETRIPKARALGAEVHSGVRVRRLLFQGSRAVAAEVVVEGQSQKVEFNHIFICAGAIQSALLLRRSGIKAGIGNTLTMNPMIRVAVRFEETVNDPKLGVPVHQIEAFKPRMTLGCSHSSPAHLALWLADQKEGRRYLERWEKLAIYYVKVSGEARGHVRNMPAFEDALVHFPVTDGDLKALGLGLDRLSKVLFAAGAVEFFNPLAGAPSLKKPGDFIFEGRIPSNNSLLSAIHLHSTIPLGGPVDSYGKLRNIENVYVNDSSLLPDTPGINPQGTVLALAARNVARFLSC
jgi:choline dehydrogenase-like flavoprotein